MSLVGIAIWGSVAFLIYLASFGGTAPLPAPAVGWTLFAGLGVIYFAMAYMLLGSLFLGIGAHATNVRAVPTLSMPVKMGQVLLFFLASYDVNWPGKPAGIDAILFPLYS